MHRTNHKIRITAIVGVTIYDDGKDGLIGLKNVQIFEELLFISKARQENLYAVYETTDRKFWTELAKCNQEEFKKSGTEGTCIEARELIIALSESFVDYEPDKLLKLFTEHFRQNYDV